MDLMIAAGMFHSPCGCMEMDLKALRYGQHAFLSPIQAAQYPANGVDFGRFAWHCTLDRTYTTWCAALPMDLILLLAYFISLVRLWQWIITPKVWVTTLNLSLLGRTVPSG